MIPHDLVYYRPASVAEALEAFREADSAALDPVYLGGGTEIVTMIRDGRLRPRALVDLKGVSDCAGLAEGDGHLRLGSCLTLAEAEEQSLFPLLAEASRGVADHSVRSTITLGGNIAGRLPYREAVLPLLVLDAQAEIAGEGGRRQVALGSLFDRRLRLGRGEALIALSIDAAAARLPCLHLRRTKDSPIDYPLVSASFAREGSRLRAAVSGLCDYPLRLRDQKAGSPLRAADLLAQGGVAPRADPRGSAEYRLQLFQGMLEEAAARLGGEG